MGLLEIILFEILLLAIWVTGLVDNHLSAPPAESLFETLVAGIASLDDLVVVTALKGFQTHG